MSRLLKYIPPYERNSEVFQEILKAEENEFDKLDMSLRDLENQFFVETATWGLSIYEKALGLAIEPDIPVGIRRSLVKSKMLMQPPSSKLQFVSILKSFVETAEVEEYFSEYKFNVALKTLDTVGDKLIYINRVVEEFKPAHLEYMLLICYLYYLKVFIEFDKYPSEEFKICGTIDVNGKEYHSTKGKSFKGECVYNFKKWNSDTVRVASKSAMITSEGKSYKTNTNYVSISLLSNTFKKCSENIYAKEME